MEATLDLEHQAERVTESGHGREPAICELWCENCGDGVKYDMPRCSTCGFPNLRFASFPVAPQPFIDCEYAEVG